ncbi:MAG: FAD binding domain-containing protein [Sulfolobales archaeon]
MSLILRTTLPDFDYLSPSSLDELLALKAKYGERAAVIAGGTVLLNLMRLGFRYDYVIDIKGVRELSAIEYREGRGLVIGAAATLKDLENNEFVREKYGVLWDAVRQIGDFHLRNRATIGGNICNPTLQADTIAPLAVLGASIEVSSMRGSRRVAIWELVKEGGGLLLDPDEILTRIYIPELPKGSRGAYFKVWWIAGIAALAANIDNPRERIVRVAYSFAPSQELVEGVEKIFRQEKPLKVLIGDAINYIKTSITPPSDARASREYREHLVEFGTAYLLRKLLGVEV